MDLLFFLFLLINIFLLFCDLFSIDLIVLYTTFAKLFLMSIKFHHWYYLSISFNTSMYFIEYLVLQVNLTFMKVHISYTQKLLDQFDENIKLF